MRKLVILLITIMMISVGLFSGCTSTIDTNSINANNIKPDAPESPIRKYFTVKKITWSFDDYWVHTDHHPPHRGFDGLSQQVHSYGGYVNILVIFGTPWILEYFGNEIRNYSVVQEFAPIHKGFLQDYINLSLEFFDRDYIFITCHDWNHSDSVKLNEVNLSQAYKIINFSLWNLYNNYHIKPHFWLGRSSRGNYNISLALKRFSETYWTVYAEGFSGINKEGHYQDGNSPAVEYIGDCCDPAFGWDWGPGYTLPEAQQYYVNYAQDREIVFMRVHPSILNDTSHQDELKMWQDYIDWIYQKHELININHTQAIEYKIDRNNFSVKKNSEGNYIINLSLCQFNHNVLFSPPDNNNNNNNNNDQWELYDENGNNIGVVQGDMFFLLERGHNYYFTRLTLT